MKEIKYIITDLDGTILKSTKNGISNNTIKIVNEFQKKYDYNLTIATGRHVNMIKEYIDKLNIKLPIITSNGALITNPKNNNVLNIFKINNDIFQKILKELKSALKIDIVVYSDKNIYLEKKSKRLNSIIHYNNNSVKNYNIKYKIVNNILDTLNISDKILKLLITFNDKEKEVKIIKKIIKNYPELIITSSNDNLCDINSINATKGNALLKLTKILKIDINKIIVYGDNENDIDLFKKAKYSVAPDNAVLELKNFATEIIEDMKKDSVAKHIKKNFLENK